jgi:hypothetical protein
MEIDTGSLFAKANSFGSARSIKLGVLRHGTHQNGRSMSSSHPNSKPTWYELVLIAILVLVAVAAAYKSGLDTRRYPNLRVEIEPYQWQPGCDYRSTVDPNYILKRCARSYRLRNSTELGLFERERARWYRIGDDAVLMKCMRIGKYCEVRDRVWGKFVRPGYYRSLERDKLLGIKPQGASPKAATEPTA